MSDLVGNQKFSHGVAQFTVEYSSNMLIIDTLTSAVLDMVPSIRESVVLSGDGSLGGSGIWSMSGSSVLGEGIFSLTSVDWRA